MPELYSLTKTTNGQRVLCLGGRPLITLNRSPLYEAGNGLDTPAERQTFAEKLVEQLNWVYTHGMLEDPRGGAYVFGLALAGIICGGVGLCIGMLI